MASDYDNFGGQEFFTNLVKDFYKEILNDPILKPMYPEDDMAGAVERLTLFLIQYWGGPTTYSDLRGHPRLRMRHAAFPIDFVARDSWLKNMAVAIEKQNISNEIKNKLWNYFQMAADSMVNTRNDGII
jgi:hemoglobin